MSLKNKIYNQQGVALMMVISAIVLLSAIMLTFGLESSINKIKTYNQEDKAQAKLTAESGLKFALARLKLYKAAYNYIQANDGVSNVAKPEIVNLIWNFPFVYPIPITKNMNTVQKEAIAKFEKGTLLEGNLRLTINNISNKMNLNALRVALLNNSQEEDDDENNENTKADEKYNVESQLVASLTRSFENKIANDDDFSARYAGMQLDELINNIKFNVSDPETLESGSAIAANFSNVNLTPKNAPLASMSELYSIPGWDDELVELIKNEFTTHGAIMIDLNKITDKMLRIIIPNITEDEIADFFKYKDDPENPHYFNSLDDFKKYIVSIANLMSEDNFNSLIQEFEKNGIKFGPSPTLFKVISVGEKGRSTYTLTAYISMPAKPAYKKTDEDEDEDEDENEENENDEKNEKDENKTDEKPKTYLLEPRVLEIYAR
ncbi:MAG: type II secretion system protein GspK [Bacteriovoracaceae bacterium]|nr:type II secretion system protein GspK [Bacteriovoracaceae bacterium]